jgi:hypothetical protein
MMRPKRLSPKLARKAAKALKTGSGMPLYTPGTPPEQANDVWDRFARPKGSHLTDMREKFEQEVECMRASAKPHQLEAEMVHRVGEVEKKIDRLLLLLTRNGYVPTGFRLTTVGCPQGQKHTAPSSFLFRALMAGIPFEINGINYWPTESKRVLR